MDTSGIFHQFEVRFTGMLNFPQMGKMVVSPYVQLSDRVSIENEGRVNERIRLHFDGQGYHIDLHWDKLILRYEGDLNNLINENSIIDEPFLSILGKLKDQPSFGLVTYSLTYTILVGIIDKPQNEIIEDFASKTITPFTSSFLEGFTDVAITLDKSEGELEQHITVGPYIGITDILNRIREFSADSLPFDQDSRGIMTEIKVLKKNPDIDFRVYKSLVAKTFELSKKVWE